MMTKDCLPMWSQPDYGMRVLGSDWYKMMFKLQNAFVKGSMEFYFANGLDYIPLPVTCTSISSPMGLGSDSSPVEIELNGKKVYLADSMQFLLEYGTRMAEKGCFYLMPSFRGEPTDSRHLSQFFHSEAEIKGGLEAVISFVNEYVSFLSRYFIDNLSDQIEKYAGTTEHLKYIASKPAIPVITYRKAIELLEGIPGAVEMIDMKHPNITSLGEKKLLEQYNGYLWVTHYCETIVPFYQATDGEYARNADLLMGIGETVGAGERHSDYVNLKESIIRHNVDPKDYGWYIQMKKKYPMLTSGFGLGMERFLLWVLKHDDIRDCQIVSRIDDSVMQP